MLDAKSKTFLAQLPRLSDEQQTRVEAWMARRCARGVLARLDGVFYLVAQREAARTAKMSCRLMRAALKRCGVIPGKRHWLELVGEEQFETILQRYTPQSDKPFQGAAPADEDRVVELPSQASRRSAPAASAEDAEDGSRLFLARGAF